MDVLIQHIAFKSRFDLAAIEQQSAQSEEMSTSTWDALFEDAFRSRLIRYLRGRGHPNHPDVIEVVGQETFVREEQDPLLRARLFLQMMSGSDLVPIDKEWKLKVDSASTSNMHLSAHPSAGFFLHRGRRDPSVIGSSGTTAIERPVTVMFTHSHRAH